MFFTFLKQVEPDGQCLMNAALPQFLHQKEWFNADLLQKQVALHMLKHANLFYPYVQQDLLDSGESYESYCVNIFNGKVWGDDFILSALGHMFNIAITIISPCFDNQLDLFHTKEIPDVVVIANGGDYITGRRPCTHFSGSHVKSGIKFKMAGSEMKNPNLKPVIFSGYQRGVDDSLRHFLQEEKDMTLLKLRAVCKDIEHFDSKVVELIHCSDKLLKKKEQIEHKLENLGVKVEEIKKAGHVKEREYVRTEQSKQQAEASKAAESILKEMGGVDVLNLQLTEDNPIDSDLKEDLNTVNQLITEDQLNIPQSVQPQSSILEENVTQVEGGHITQDRVNKLLIQTGMNPNLLKYLPGNQNFQIPIQTMPQIPQPLQQDTGNQQITQFFQQIPGNQQSQQVVETIPQSNSETVLQTPRTFQQLPEQFQPIAQSIQVIGEQKDDTKQEGSEQLVLVQNLGVRSAPRSRTTVGPVPENLQDKTKYKYCNRCPHKYTTRTELLRHQRESCLKAKREYYCPECLKSYYSKTSLREHYYQTHLKKALYRCLKCGKEFANKSRKSDHKKSCPQKEQEDKFPDVKKDPNFEQLFVKGVLISDVDTGNDPVVLETVQQPAEIAMEQKEEPIDVEQETVKVVEQETEIMETDEKDENNDNMEELLRLAGEAAKKPKLDT